MRLSYRLLEPRMVFDAALAATVADAGHAKAPVHVDASHDDAASHAALVDVLHPASPVKDPMTVSVLPMPVTSADSSATPSNMIVCVMPTRTPDAVSSGATATADKTVCVMPARTPDPVVIADTSAGHAVAPATAATGENIVFVDAAVTDAATITAHVAPGAQVVMLNANSDGLNQIAAYLSTHHDVASIHILSHGASGELQLGNSILTDANLADHQAALATISHALKPGGDILIYGCSVGSGTTGAQFINHIAALTGDVVAASTDATGAKSLGGDWVLEDIAGATSAAAADHIQQITIASPEWDSLLTLNVTTNTTATTLVNSIAPAGASGITIVGTPTITGTGTGGSANYAGTFTTTGSNLGIASGIVLGSGAVSGLSGTPSTTWTGAGSALSVPAASEFDSVTLTFSFTPNAGVSKLNLQSIFGSEEYRYYVNSTFNDRFSITLSGGTYSNSPIALVPGTATPVSINTVNNGTSGPYGGTASNPAYFRDNTVATPPVGDVTLNGLTTVINDNFVVVPGTTYTVSIHIADIGDNQLNSAVFVGAFGAALQIDLDANNSSGKVGADYQTTFTEGGTAVKIGDVDRTITNLDPTTSIQTATITLTNPSAGDSLAIGTLPSGVSSSSTVNALGQTVITLTGAGSAATYQTAIDAITFSNSAVLTDPAVRDVTVVVNDGTTNSNVAHSYITVKPVDNAPVIATAAASQTVAEDTALIFNTANANAITVSDVDAAASGLETVTLSVAHGTLNLGSTAGITGLSGNGTGAVTFTGTVAQVNAAVAGLAYQGVANYNGADTLTITTIDDGKDNGVLASNGPQSAITKTIAINVTPVNDPPVLDLDGTTAGTGHVATYTENGTPVSIAAADLSVTDVDNTTMQSATIVLTNRQVGDVLAIGTLPLGIQYAIDASNPAQITVTLTGTSSLANYQTAIQSVTFLNSTDSPSPVDRTVTVVVNDGAADSNVATSVIHVVPVNDAPMIAQALTVYTTTPGVSDNTFLNGTITNGTSAATAVHAASVDIPAGTALNTVSAVINLTYFDNSGTVIVNGTNIIPAGAFEVENQVNPGETRITFADGSYSNTPWLANSNGLPRFEIIITNGSVQIWGTRSTTSTTLEQMQLVSGTFAIPTFTTGTNSIQVVNLDGGGPDSAAGTIQVFANLTTPPQTTAEDTPIVFNAANGNAINFSDVDAGPSGQETVTLAVAHGTLNLATTSGLTGLTGNGTGAITFTGTVAQINAAVAGLSYANTPDYNGTDSLTITVHDDGKDNGTATSNGILSATPKVIPITITPVADITNDTIATLEDTSATFNVLTGTGGATADSFENPAAAVTSITQPAHGSVTFAANGQMTYTPTGNYNGPDSFTYTVTSGGVTETATVTVNVQAVNDAPVSAVPGPQTINEDTPLVFTGANAIAISDVDAGASGQETVILSVGHGTLNLGGLPVGLTYTNNGTGTVTLTGTLSQVNAAITGLTYQGAANYNGPDLLTVQVKDDGTDNGVAATNGALGGVVHTVAINVVPVNDAPAGNDHTAVVTENGSYSFAVADFGFTDPNDQPANNLQSIIITTLPPSTDGALSYLNAGGTRVAVTAGQELTPAQIATMIFTPALNKSGTSLGAFTFQVRDDGGVANGGKNLDQSPNTFNFNVTFVNQPPVAINDAYTTDEHTTLTIPAGTGPAGNGLLANDSDVDNAHASLAVTQINGNALATGAPIVLPSGAILTQNADGSFAYNPNGVYNGLTAGQHATDTFTYQVSDGAGGFATASATVTINGINDPPVAVADTNTAGPLTVLTTDAAHGVLVNDTDIDTAHNLLAVSAVNGVAGNVNTAVAGSNGGLFTVHPDGSYTFDPNGQFNGIVATTSVSYTVTDGTNTSTTTLTIAVPYQNLPPYVAQPVPAQTSLDGNAVALDLSHVFSDPNGSDQGHLTISQTGLPPGLSLTPATDAVTGITTYAITGTLTSDASQHAGPYVVTLTATDPSGSTTTTTFNFNVANPAPVAVDDTNSVLEHGTTSGNVVTNDHDGGNDHDPLSVSLVNGKPYTPGSVITLTSGAQLVMGADGTYTYDTHGAFNGLAVGVTTTDQFTYQVSDGQGGFATATATITITGQNDNPVVVDPAHPGTPPADPNHIVPAQIGTDGTAITPLTVTGFFHDPDNGDHLTLSTTGQLPNGVTFNPATGTFSGTPDSNASQGGPANNGVYSILVTADDGHGGVVSTVVTFTIGNNPPVAGNDSATVLEHSTVTASVLANDHDGGGDTDPLSVATVNGQTIASGATITLPSGALLVMNANGQYTYDPHGAFASLSANQNATDTFTYTISDGQGGTAQATVTIQIQGQNDNPVALLDTNTTNPQVPVSADAAHGVLANDTDAEHDPLAVTSITNGTATVAAGSAIGGTGGGTFTIAADGSYTFDPGTDFNNLAQGASATSSVTYTISDGHGGFSSTTLTVTVPYENLPPVVKQPVPTQNALDGNAVSIPVAGVFSDPNTIDTLTITATGLPPGLAYNPATGAVEGTLTSDASQHGGMPYTVTLQADDGHGGITTSTFVFNVGNPPPIASADVNTVTEHGTTAGNVIAGDPVTGAGADHDGLNDRDPLSVAQVNGHAYTPGGTITLASGALLVMNADGTYSYDPHGAFNGLAVGQTATDTFTYQVSDGQGGVSTATVTITITGQNEPPVVLDPAHPGTPPIDPNHIAPVQSAQDGSAITPLDVKGFFADPDKADTLTLSVDPAALPTGVTFVNGVFAGAPDANASQHGNVPGVPGAYDVVVTASDGHGGTVSTTVRFTVTNPAPVATGDVNTVAEHGTITNAASVLGNDHDGGADTDPLAVTQVNGTAITTGSTIVLPSGAHLIMNTDGTYSYDPNGSFAYLQVGQATTDHFSYQVSDGQGGFATATVTITINGQNDAPIAANDANTVTGETASIMVAAPLGVLANDADPEHGILTVSAVNVGGATGTTVAAGTAIHGSNGGTFTINADGSYAFNPGTDFSNLAPGQIAQTSVTYTVTDDHGATATATLTISVPYENLPPVLNQVIPAQSSFDGNPVSIDVTNVFKDPNAGDILKLTASTLPPGLQLVTTTDPITHAITSAFITGTLNANASNHTGPWAITLTATDPSLSSVSTTFNFTVNNQPPVAANDTNTVLEHGTTGGNVITGDPVTHAGADHDGGLDTDPISVNLVAGGAVGTPITLASGAIVTMQADGTYVYNTNNAFNGLALGQTATDSFSYQITDSQGATATATVSITINGQNDTPVVVDPAHPGVLVTPGTQVVPTTPGLDGSAITPLTVTGVFADPDHGDTLTLSVDPASVLPAGIHFDPATGSFTGTLGPDASQGGPDPLHPGTYPVTVIASDGHGGTVSTLVVFQIANPAPVASADTNTVLEHGTTAGNVLTGDPVTGAGADHDGGADSDPLHVSQVNGVALVPGATITLPSGAQLVMAADGTYTYNPNGVFNGLGAGQTATDTFTYQVSDGQGGFATATATVTINGQNDAPIVVDPVTGLPPVDPVTHLPVDPLHVVPGQPAADGSAITPVNVTAFFHDPDNGDHLTLSVDPATLPPGIVFNPATGTFSGTPTSNASQGGPDAAHPGVYPITVTATDTSGATVTTVVTFSIINPPPVAVADTNTVLEHGTTTGNVLTGDPVTGAGADHDGGADSDPLHVTLVNGNPIPASGPITLPDGALLTIAADGTYTYNPNGHFNGLGQGQSATEQFTYQVSDSNGGVSQTTVTITVNGVNDAPIVVDPATGLPPVDPATHLPADPLHVVPSVAGQDGTPIANLNVTGYFQDPDTGDHLTLSVPAASLPPGITFDPATGTFSGTPSSNASQGGPAHNGIYPITVTATDSFGASTTTIVTYTFTNPAPVATLDTLATHADVVGSGNVLTNDHDGGADHDPLSVTQINGVALQPGVQITLPSGALLTMNTDGSYSYDPNGIGNTLANGATKPDSFTYQVSDGQGGFDTATVNITIQAINKPPVVIDPVTGQPPVDPLTHQPADPLHVVPTQTGLDGNAITTLSVASYFTDPNSGDVLTYTVPAGSLPAGVTFDTTTGTFSGTPASAASQGGPAHNGTYPIVVTANDGNGGTVSTIVTFQIGNVPPVAADDTLSVPVHGTLGTGSVLLNDHDGGHDTDPLSVSGVNGAAFTPGTAITLPSGALLTMNTDGTYTYNPNGTHPGLGSGETATDSFTYQVSDGQGGFANATVNITVTGVNDPPIVIDPATGLPPVDPVTHLPTDPLHVVPALAGADGSAIAPLNVSGYFTDPNTHDTLTLSVDPASVLPAGIHFDPATGSFTGTLGPNASQGGPDPLHPGTYPVTVTASDGHGGTVSTLVVFQIANPAPVASADTNTVLEHGTTTGNVLTGDPVTGAGADHDGGADSDPLHVSQVNGVALVPGATITLPSGAQLVMAADGTYTYNPNGVFNGLGAGQTATDTFTYQVSDGQGGFATATATVTINGQNDAPIVVDPVTGLPPVDPVTHLPVDPLHVVPGQPAADGSAITPVNVTAFFHDPDNGDHLTLSVDPATLPPGIVFNPATGTFSGTPTSNASQGGPDAAHPGVYPITVTATDTSGATVTTVVTFSIINPPPVAVADTNTVLEHGTTTGNVLSNDHDGGHDTDPLHVTLVNDHALVPGATITLPSGALLTMKPDGTYAYNPNGVFQGLSVGETGTDTFTYQVSDGNGGFATATVNITVVGENDPPVVVDPAHPGTPPADPLHVIPAVSGHDGDAIAPVSVASVFHDPDHHDTLTFSVAPGSLPPGIHFDPVSGSFSGTPGSDASQGGPKGDGTYPIVVTASDGHGGTVSTIVTFKFTNVPPVAGNDTAVGQPGQPLNIDVLANDHDGGSDHDPLTIVAATASTGKVTINPNGSLDFTPASGFVGVATITYTISDGQGGFSTATATVLITPDIHVAPPASPNVPAVATLLPSNTGITAPGAVLDAVHGADTLGTSSTELPTGANGIATTGIVDIAANQLSSLGGLTARTIGGAAGYTDHSGITDSRETSPVWRLQNLITQRFGAPSENWSPEGLTGFSLRYTFAADPLSNAHAQIVLDSIVRDRTLIVNLSSTKIPDHAHVVEYRVMQADGRALPGWLDHAGNVLIGEHPVDAETVKLHVIAVMSDGSTIERDVVIQTNSGEIQPLKETKRSDVTPLFSDQIKQFAESDQTDFERLLTALAG